MKIVLFEDHQCLNLHPIGLFRPLFETHCGALTLFHVVKQLKHSVRAIIREQFLIDDEKLPSLESPLPEPHLFLNAAIEPDIMYVDRIHNIVEMGEPFISTYGNQVIAAYVSEGTHLPGQLTSQNITQVLMDLKLPPQYNLFRILERPHQYVSAHLRLFEKNLESIIDTGKFELKEKDVYIYRNTDIAPSVVFNTSHGPVVIESNVSIKPFTYIEGPVYIGRDTRIIEHSSVKNNTSIAHGCLIGGEIETTTVEAHSNKQHHGYVGHSWIGRWVNLSAGTTTSNLKNTYGKVRIAYHKQRIGTGMEFLGSIIGDYSKTGINTSLFTGKIIGVCSMIYGMVATNVPSFSNYARSFNQISTISPDQAITTQERMYARRNREQSSRDRELIRRVHRLTRTEQIVQKEQITF